MALTNQDPALRPSVVPWPPILLAAIVGGSIALARYVPIEWPGVDDLPAKVVGVSLGVSGCLLVAWAVVTLVRSNTTVMPHHGVSRLVTSGPYAWRRNPIYLGEMLMLLAAAGLTRNVWFILLTLVFGGLITWLAILPEERHLEAKFGDAWHAYADSTRRLL